jgi:hypothetical protein
MIHNACELIDCLCHVRFHVPVAKLRGVKAKFTLEQATVVQRGSRGIALLFL